MADLERDIGQLREIVRLLAERCDGLQEAVESLALENQAVRLRFQAAEHGRGLMRHLEQQ